MKHHWWWKTSFTFSHIKVLRDFSRVVTFLEEDQYLLPDALRILYLLETEMVEDKCFGCNIVALASANEISYKGQWNMDKHSGHAKATPGFSNFGMSFNRTLWEQIKGNCGRIFCTRDDYNWDHTLLHVSHTCLEEKLKVVFPVATRVFHIGEW